MSLLVLIFVAVALVAWTRWRREAPLVKEIQARPVTHKFQVTVKASSFGAMTSQRGMFNLDVHGDSFRVFHPFPPARSLFGQDYSYRAQSTTVETIPGFLHDWIEIRGQLGTEAARIQVARRKMNRQIWDVLVASGAHPIGLPPAL